MSRAIPKSAILTTRPEPLVVSRQFRAAMSRWIKWFPSRYSQPLATSMAHKRRSFITRGDGRSWNEFSREDNYLPHFHIMARVTKKGVISEKKIFYWKVSTISETHQKSIWLSRKKKDKWKKKCWKRNLLCRLVLSIVFFFNSFTFSLPNSSLSSHDARNRDSSKNWPFFSYLSFVVPRSNECLCICFRNILT